MAKKRNTQSQLQLIETRITRSHKPDRGECNHHLVLPEESTKSLKPINSLRELPRPCNYDNVSRESCIDRIYFIKMQLQREEEEEEEEKECSWIIFAITGFVNNETESYSY